MDEKQADMPVQAPTKYELVTNLKDRQGARLRHPSVRVRAPTR
jgi:hypothetical protein